MKKYEEKEYKGWIMKKKGKQDIQGWKDGKIRMLASTEKDMKQMIDMKEA